VVAAVAMDPDHEHYQPQPSFGGWLQPGPALARKVVIPLGIASGTLSYSLSRDRRRKAQSCLTRTARPFLQPGIGLHRKAGHRGDALGCLPCAPHRAGPQRADPEVAQPLAGSRGLHPAQLGQPGSPGPGCLPPCCTR